MTLILSLIGKKMKKHPQALLLIFSISLFLSCTTPGTNIQKNSNIPDDSLLGKKVEIPCIDFNKRSISLNEITFRSKRYFYMTVISKIPAYRESIVRNDVWLRDGMELKYIPFVIDKNYKKGKYENPDDYYQKAVDGFVFLEMVFIDKAGGIIFDNYYKATALKKTTSLPGAACDLWIMDFHNETGLDAFEEFGLVVNRKKCLEELQRLLDQVK